MVSQATDLQCAQCPVAFTVFLEKQNLKYHPCLLGQRQHLHGCAASCLQTLEAEEGFWSQTYFEGIQALIHFQFENKRKRTVVAIN